MQVSALNLIIAAQQARSSAPPRTAVPQNATSPAAATFAPRPFEPAQASPPPSASITAPIGSQIDIRV